MPDPLDFTDAAADVAAEDARLAEEQRDDNPFRDAATQVVGAERSILKASMATAKQADPDKRARAMQLAKVARVPVEMVEENEQEFAEAVRREVDPDQLRAEHPDLADWLSNPDRAAISRDDLPALRQLDVAARALRGEDPTGVLPPGYLFQGDRIIRPIGDGSQAETWNNLEDLARDLRAKGERGLVAELDRKLAADAYDREWGWMGNLMAGGAQSIMASQRAMGTRSEYDRQGEEVVDASTVNAPGWFGDVQRGIGGLVADVPLMLTGGPLAKGVGVLQAATRTRAALAGIVGRTAARRASTGLNVAAAVQPLAVREGITEGQDNGAVDGALAWMVETAVPGAFGRTGLERALVPGSGDAVADGWRGAVKRLLTDAGMEGTEEAVTEFAHAVREYATGADPEALDSDKLLRRLAAAGTVGAVAGGTFNLPVAVADKFLRDGEEARRATVHAERLDRMVDLLAESKTNGRAPDEVAALTETTLGQGGRHLFVDADAFRAAFPDPEAAAKQLGISEDYTRALATGGQVQVPTVKLLQTAANDEAFRALIKQARRSPEARTATEADEFQARAPEALQQLQNEARAATGEAGQQTTDTEREVADIERQLVERLNAVSSDQIDRGAIQRQAKIVASAFGALAKRSGKSPSELFTLKLRGDVSRLMRGERFDLMDAMIERWRRQEIPTEREAFGPSLVDFLRKQGLADKALAGELRSLAESDRTRKPGERNLIREDGIDLDTAAMMAAEAGYLEEATPNALLAALDEEVRGNTPKFSTKGGNPEAQAARESIDMLADAIREAGGNASMSNKEIRALLADLEDKRGAQGYGQQANTIAPKGKSLDVDALLRQWRKATGDRTPVGGIEAWEQLVEESAAIDEANGTSLNQPAYHGTPHKFDKFTTDNMGGGEGAQAFGWGLYFAGRKEVAQYYKEALAADYMVDGKPVREATDEVYDALGVAVEGDAAVDQRIAELNDANARMQQRAEGDNKPLALSYQRAIDSNKKEIAALERFRGRVTRGDGGRLYTVEIPEDGEYLLWDKPLSEQPEAVQKAIAALREVPEIYQNAADLADQPTVFDGQHLYRSLERALKSDERASKELLGLGIKGIKYLDGSSRNQGDGTYNYVIFDGADAAIQQYEQNKGEQRRADIRFDRSKGLGRTYTIRLFQGADVSSFLHESGHLFLELMGDLSKLPTADQSLKDDAQRVLDWLGAKDFDSITEEQHETFARGFERYLMEGVAPASHLREAFARIKAWMVAIYRTVANLRVELTPEIRGVFDRLVAAEDAADLAESAHGAALLPPETFGSLAEFEGHRQSVQASRQATRDRVEAQLLDAFQQEATKAWQAQRAEVEQQVADEVDAQPVYQVIAALQRGQTPRGETLPDEFQGLKLDRADLVAQWGEEVLKRLPGPTNISENKANRGAVMYASEGGLAIDAVAKSWGFPSGDAMVEAMIAAPDRVSLIQTTTDRRMKELRPDPLTDGTLTDKAQAALATDQRAEVFRRELAALGRRTGQTPAPIEVLRQVARDQIARTRVYDLAPDRFRIAAAKAARLTVDAAARQQWDEAYRAKLQDVLNMELYRAARDAQEAGEQGRAYLRTFDTLAKRERLGKAGGGRWQVFDETGSPIETTDDLGETVAMFDTREEARAVWEQNGRTGTYRQTNGYLEQIDDILDGFKLRRASNRQLRRKDAFRKWIERQQREGEPVDIDPEVFLDLGTRNWNDLTVEEQASVVDAVRNVEKLANLKNKLLKAARERDLDKARADIVGTIVQNQPTPLPDGQFDDVRTNATGKMLGYFEAHRKDSFLARRMDGDQDGGVVWDYLIRARNEAAGAQETMSAEASEKLSALFKEWGKSAGHFGQAIAGTRLRMTTEQRIALALNWGNPQGRQRVVAYLKRGGWTTDDAQAVLDSLDASDWKLVNGVIRQINSYWSDVVALDQRTKGIAPEKVEALPFVTKLGVQPGGYYPIDYDPKKSTKAGDLQAAMEAKEMLRAAGASAQTKRNHTKMRAAKVDDLALRFDLGVIGEHLSSVIHDLTHRELMLDQNRLLRDKDIKDAILSRYGRGALDQFVTTAADIAKGDAPARTAAEKLLKALRINNSAAAFGFNLTSALMNVTGVMQSMTRVGPARMAQAVARLFRSPDETNNGFSFVAAKSDMMRNRSRTMLREVADATRAVQAGGKLQTIQRWGYYPMMQVQRVVDTITWLGAYEQALAKAEKEGKTGQAADDLAVAIADQTVVDTQGSGRIADLSAFQRGGEGSKLLTAFYSYFNVAANLQGSAIRRVYQDPRNAGKWARLVADTMLVWTLPALLGNLIRSALAGDERDEKDRWSPATLAREQASYGMGMLVGLREASGVVESGRRYSGPAGTRGLGAIVEGIGEAFDGKVDKTDAKALSSLAGVFTGLPSVQINRLIDAVVEDAAKGKEGEALRRALFGAPKQ